MYNIILFMMAGDRCLYRFVGWLTGIEIKKLVESVLGEGFFSTDNEFLVDTAFADANPVNLAY